MSRCLRPRRLALALAAGQMHRPRWAEARNRFAVVRQAQSLSRPPAPLQRRADDPRAREQRRADQALSGRSSSTTSKTFENRAYGMGAWDTLAVKERRRRMAFPERRGRSVDQGPGAVGRRSPRLGRTPPAEAAGVISRAAPDRCRGPRTPCRSASAARRPASGASSPGMAETGSAAYRPQPAARVSAKRSGRRSASAAGPIGRTAPPCRALTPPLSGTSRAASGEVNTTSSWNSSSTASTSCAFHASFQRRANSAGSGQAAHASSSRAGAARPAVDHRVDGAVALGPAQRQHVLHEVLLGRGSRSKFAIVSSI